MSIDGTGLSLRQRNQERLRQRILSAALDLFTEMGYNRTTMDAIAEKAEVGRATLFKYFPTKSALLIPLSQRVLFAELQPQVLAYLEQGPTTIEAFRSYFHLLGMRIQELSDVAHASIKVLNMSEGKTSEQVPGFSQTLSAILRYGQARGEVRDDLAVEVLGRYISVLYGVIVTWMVEASALEGYPVAIDEMLAFVATGLTK